MKDLLDCFDIETVTYTLPSADDSYRSQLSIVRPLAYGIQGSSIRDTMRGSAVAQFRGLSQKKSSSTGILVLDRDPREVP